MTEAVETSEAPRSDQSLSERAAFIRANTRPLRPPLVPEIELRLAAESVPIWQKTEDELGEIGLPPPFWAFAWAGGQALARHLLDHRDLVAGRHVLDLASGSGLVAIAAGLAGAASVKAAEIDPFAISAIAINATANGVTIEVLHTDLLTNAPLPVDLVLVGDLFYERELAGRALAWLRACRAAGQEVLIGDPGRAYLPKDCLEEIAHYGVPVTRELEDSDIKQTRVWRLRG